MARNVFTYDIARLMSKNKEHPKGELDLETNVVIDWNDPQEGLEVDLSTDYVFIGAGNRNFDEAPNAQTQESAYTSMRSKATVVTGYNYQFTGTSEDIADDDAAQAMLQIPYKAQSGDDAEHNLILIDMVEKIGATGEKYPARLFRISVAVNTIANPGTEMRTFDFTLSAVKDPVLGVYDKANKTFTVNKEQQ